VSSSNAYKLQFTALQKDASSAVSVHLITKKYLPALAHVVDEWLRELLRHVQCASITSDGWCDNAMQKYVAVTIHYMRDNNFQFVPQHATLALDRFVALEMTSRALSKFVKGIVDRKVSDNTMICCFVSDGAKNALGAAEMYAEDDAVWCFAHLLALVVRYFIKQPEYAQLIGYVRFYSAKIRKSANRTKQVLDLQMDLKNIVLQPSVQDLLQLDECALEQLADKFDEDTDCEGAGSVVLLSSPSSSSSSSNQQRRPLRLLLDQDTRWSSTFTMLRRFARLLPYLCVADSIYESFQKAEMKEAMFAILGSLPQLRAIACLLEPFATLTTVAQGEHYATLAHVPLWIVNLKTSLECLREEANALALDSDRANDAECLLPSWAKAKATCEFVSAGATFLLDEVARRFDCIHSVEKPHPAMKAALLCPQYASPKSALAAHVSLELRDAVWKALKADARIAFPYKSNDFVDSDDSFDSSECEDSSSDGGGETRHFRFLEKGFNKIRHRFEHDLTLLDTYGTATEFWTKSKLATKNPNVLAIRPLVAGLLSAPAVSSSSESVFSVAGAAKSARRSSLSGINLARETMVSRNLHLFDMGDGHLPEETLCERTLQLLQRRAGQFSS
jgi:hypothetical protein